jgi:RNA polymerase sigma-70 factor (ECF subfamily)
MRFKILPEDELIHEALNGSRAHLNVLISMYEPFIIDNIGKQIKNHQELLELRQSVCCKMAEQIAQKAYVHQEKFSHWANCIIKNEINSYFRRKKQNIVLYFSSETMDTLTDEQLLAAEDDLALTSNMSYYVDQLCAEQAVVIKLKCFQDKTFRQISEMLKVPINTVMGRYRYGIERIREMLKQ